MANYDYWLAALEGNFGPVFEDDVQPGFWRKRVSRAGEFVPVAVWEDNGKLVALVDGKMVEARDQWTYICRFPISEENYHSRMNTGKWHDESEAVTESLAHDPKNSPIDPAEILQDQIDAALKGVDDYAEIKDDEALPKAQSLRSRLLELSGNADRERESQKKPHLEAGRVIDSKFQPLVKTAKEGADRIRAAMSAYETAKERIRRAAEAETARLAEEARKAALAAAEAGKPVPEPPPMPPAAPVPETRTKVAGSYGRAATIKTKKLATVVDQDLCYSGLKTHKELIELIGKLAQRAVDAGITLPGVTFEEIKDVR